MSKSLKANYIFNLVNTGTQFLFPLITFPYASRIMGPEGIGIVNFYQSIISYVILIAGLGIPLYGVKEIARVREDKEKLNQTTLEILSLHSALTVIAYLIIAILVIFVPRINENGGLFLLLSMSILFTTIGCEWFYKGTEDFKYITTLGIVVKTIAMFLLFLLVKERQDLLWYGLFCVFVTVGSNFFNFIRLRRFISFKTFQFHCVGFKKHIKSILHIFVFSVITSLYLNLNPIILGFISSDDAVGYYSTGLKLFSITSSIVGSLAVVMLPRISYLIAEKKQDEFVSLTQKAYNFSIGLSLPLCLFLFFVSPYAIRVLCGNEFEPSIICCQLMSPIIVFLAISSLMGTQILYPMGEIKTINKFCAVGAVVDITLSFILVPIFAQVGTSIAYGITEMTVMILSVFAAKKFVTIRFFNSNVRNYIFSGLIMLLLLFFTRFLNINDFIMIPIMGLAGFGLYIGLLLIVKDSLLFSVIKDVRNKNN